MSLKSALQFAKNASEEKVPFRFQFPVSIKKEFEELCEKNNVSMTDTILGLIISAIDEDRGVTDVSTLNIINKIESLEKNYQELEKVYKNTGDEALDCTDGTTIYLIDDMELTKLSINALKRELEIRSKK
ncbi:MAG: hypothetical protein PHF17_08480 [Arcobacteraceae bacterium]|nr:hypothetical protein [Arcobacteraceae bacterium]